MQLQTGARAAAAVQKLAPRLGLLALEVDPASREGAELQLIAVASPDEAVLIDAGSASEALRGLREPLAAHDAKALHRALSRRDLPVPERWACARLTELLLAGGRDVELTLEGLCQRHGLPAPPPEETEMPTFMTEREQRPAWEVDTPTKNFTLSQSWPLPEPLSAELPFGASAECLGCHDGAFAADVHHGDARMEKLECAPLCELMDRFEAALGTNPARARTIPDHPIATFYPRHPNGELNVKKPVSSQQRFFSIADLQDEQLVLPTGSVSRFYAQTPGAPPAANSVSNGRVASATPPAGNGAGEADAAEPFRLIRTTFGVMHCDSCHNAHSELHAGFLRDKSPQLCLICHDR